MAVWGIGAYYQGDDPADKTEEFINRGKAYIGWERSAAPAILKMFSSIKCGDIIYIKAFVPKSKELKIKAVGIVTNTYVTKVDNGGPSNSLGSEISVKWKREFKGFSIAVSPEMIRYNVYNNTLYEEFNPEILSLVIDSII